MSGESSGGAGLSLDRSTGDVLLNDIVSLYSGAGALAPTPVLTTNDRGPSSLERYETLLEGEAISCFIVGGEKRLCFPQVLNAVLRDIPYDEISRACSDLNINTPFSSPAQLETLKLTGVLPRNTASCGLITKSDAERLVNYLQQIRRPGQRLVPSDRPDRVLGLPVRHDCFGGARGHLFPDLYSATDAPCLECTECGHVFRPDKFVVHSHHQGAERRTCHWGFDSGNWRAYLRLQPEMEEQAEMVEKLGEVKMRFEPAALAARQLLTARLLSQSRIGLKRKADEALMEGNGKKVELGSLYDPSALLAYYTSLMRYQSLLQKAALEAVSGLLALSGSTESSTVVKPQPVKASLLSPVLPRAPAIVESPKGRGEPLKKHLLHAFAEEQKAKEELSEGSGRPESSSLSTSSASEGEEGEISLDRLLEKLVPGESLATLRSKIAESQRNLEIKIDSLQKQNAAFIHQNSLLQQENMLLKRAEKVRGLLGSLGSGMLLGH